MMDSNIDKNPLKHIPAFYAYNRDFTRSVRERRFYTDV